MNAGDLQAERFRELFSGRDDAFGTGKGEWVKRPLALSDVEDHLAGVGLGLGIAPLRDDGTVLFAAIDLDEPDFDAARRMKQWLPGQSWIERSRSGNAHVWVFFAEPIEAYVPRGIMRLAAEAEGKPRAEVFPKQDRLKPGMLGNYINLPYFGYKRPILADSRTQGDYPEWFPFSLDVWLPLAGETLNDPEPWRRRAALVGLEPPDKREKSSEFGTSPILHMCAAHIIEHRNDRPVTAGHRSVVYFSVSKQLLNWSQIDDDEAWALLQMLEETSPNRCGESELRRIFNNARNGEWTSTGCDDPLMSPYVHPDCPIAKGFA